MSILLKDGLFLEARWSAGGVSAALPACMPPKDPQRLTNRDVCVVWLVTHLSNKKINFEDVNLFSGKLKSALFHKLLRNIYETVLRSSGTNMLRLAIHSLGSPIWMAMDSDDTEFQNYGRDLIMFMYYLRILIRDKNVAVFITIPSHLYEVSTLKFNSI